MDRDKSPDSELQTPDSDRWIEINGRRIGPGRPVYVIVEMSGNHRGDYEIAEAIVREAKAAGADAIKVQTYTADTLTIDCDRPPFRIGEESLWAGRTLHQLYREAYTPWDWQPRLASVAREVGIDLFSSPFDAMAVDFLEAMGIPAYKIASFEAVDLGLIERVAATGKPVILSTGMCSLAEIEEAVGAARGAGCRRLALLKCTSAYPATPEEMNLATIRSLAETFDAPVGLSDHTLGTAVAVAGVALGASIVEKHFTLDRSAGGPDAAFSLEPCELRELVTSVRVAERAIGQVRYEPTEREAGSRIFRRSLFVVRKIAKGERITEENVRSIRPGSGLPPKHLKKILGRRASRDLDFGTPLAWDMVQ